MWLINKNVCRKYNLQWRAHTLTKAIFVAALVFCIKLLMENTTKEDGQDLWFDQDIRHTTGFQSAALERDFKVKMSVVKTYQYTILKWKGVNSFTSENIQCRNIYIYIYVKFLVQNATIKAAVRSITCKWWYKVGLKYEKDAICQLTNRWGLLLFFFFPKC